MVVKRCKQLTDKVARLHLSYEMEILLAVIEDGARGDFEQLCRLSLYSKTQSAITEVLLTDLGLTCPSKSPRRDFTACGQFVPVVS